MAEFIAKTEPSLGNTNDIYRYFNKVAPGPLRVEADEVTYHYHILLRFEIEKALIEGRYQIKDLREIWQAAMPKDPAIADLLKLLTFLCPQRTGGLG